MTDHPTRAGDRLIYTFKGTELNLMIRRAVNDIEQQAYAMGYADGVSELPAEQPVIPEDPDES